MCVHFFGTKKKDWVLTAVPRFTSELMERTGPRINPAKWGDSRVMLPGRASAPLGKRLHRENARRQSGPGRRNGFRWLTYSQNYLLLCSSPVPLKPGSTWKGAAQSEFSQLK